MSTVKVNTLTGTSTAGSIAVTGEGNSTTTNLQQGLAKAWTYSDASSTTPVIDDSFNNSSITDVSTGIYGINLTNSMSNTLYTVNCTANCNTGDSYVAPLTIVGKINLSITTTTSAFDRLNWYASANRDSKHDFTVVHGDLA
tara:strand:- start:1241 stop:1666 length:426 start_codon:yes stop_codon:yes gene_type:complete